MRIFIADNSTFIRSWLINYFSQMNGIEIVGQASDASKAIEMIRELKPDVVLMDIRLEKGTGIDVLKSIRNGQLKVKVIMMADNTYPQYKNLCLKEKADFFFSKSDETEKIIKAVERLCHDFPERNGL